MQKTDIIELIKEKYSSFTRLQKVVGDYVLEKTDNIVFSSLDKVASEIGVSTTTVIRFARSLGFAGYTELQEGIRKQVIYKKSLPSRLNLDLETQNLEKDHLAARVFQNDIFNIQETLNSLDMEQVKRAVDLLCSARHIGVLGMRGAFPLAYSMALTLGEVKKNVRLIDGIGMAYPEEAMNLEEEDVCLVYAFPRYLRMAMDMVRNIKERRVRIILVTSQAYHNMEKLVDVVIPCFVEGYSFKSSMVAPLALNNYLITEVTRRDRKQAEAMLARTEEWLNRGLYLSE